MNKTTEITFLAEKLGQQLQIQNAKVTTAESCTGGGLSSAITSVAGSSNWFEVGFVTYANHHKHKQLGVPMELFDKFGVVSREVAIAMVKGVKQNADALYAVAITGIAGPSGGSKDKPVGTVWFAFSAGEQIISKKQIFIGDRTQIREQAVFFALQELVKITGQLYALNDSISA